MQFNIWNCYILLICLQYTNSLLVNVPVSTPNIGYKDVNMYGAGIVNYITDLRQYGIEAESITSLTLEVIACSDTSVYLYDSKEGQDMTGIYNFFIGASGNTWTAIYKFTVGNSNSMKAFTYQNILECPNYASFWFDWKNGVLSYGRGTTVNKDVILSWFDVEPLDIQGVGLTTAFGQTGQWRIKTSNNFTGFFSKCGRTNTKTGLIVLDSLTAPLALCAAHCRTENCLGFHIFTPSNRCELLTINGDLEDIPFVNEAGWDFYTKCYREKEICIGCFF